MASGAIAKTRAFIAIDIPEQIRQRISAVSKMSNLFKAVEHENLHITLFFLSYITEEQIHAVESIMDSVNADSFTISIKGVSAFTQSMPRVLFAKIDQGYEEIYGIFRSTRSEIAACCKIDERELVPHIAIARARNALSGIIEARAFMDKYKDYDFGQFRCDALVLKKSIISSKGPAYENLHVKEFS